MLWGGGGDALLLTAWGVLEWGLSGPGLEESCFLSQLLPDSVLLLPQALCGCTVNVPTLDGRTIPVVFKDVIRPGMRRKVPGEGLPLPKTPEKRGDLVIEFEVIFPERIPISSRTILEQVLPI